MTSLEQILEDFSFLDDWEDRYRYVIELGKALPDLPDDKKTSANKVMGCASQVWLVTHTDGDPDNPLMTFEEIPTRISCAGWWRSCWRPIPAKPPPRSPRSTLSTCSRRSALSSTFPRSAPTACARWSTASARKRACARWLKACLPKVVTGFGIRHARNNWLKRMSESERSRRALAATSSSRIEFGSISLGTPMLHAGPACGHGRIVVP